MGLRAASVRHPNAVVMAPALTEAGQSQNFTLPPSSPINSVSQNGGYVTHDEKNTNLKLKCSSDFLNDSIFPAFNHKTTSARKAASDSNQQPHIIMSTSPIPMGDHDDTMGLQKTGIDPMTSLLKDKMPNDVEQLLNNLGDIAAAGDLTQNVDDLMQAWTIESAGVERGQGDTVETIFPITFDRDELFGEVDMIHMCEDDGSKELRAKELLDELRKKQLKLERRTEYLLRRVRKYQTRKMGEHVSGEVAGLYELVHRTLLRVKESPVPSEETSETNQLDHQPQPPVKPISTSTVDSLVRKLHMSAVQQSASSSRQKHVPSKYFGSGSAEPSVVTIRNPAPGTVFVPRLPADARDELERVSGSLHSELSVVESQIDSDATASSSGAESCDEMQTYNNPHQNFLSISKRAAWRYANERAAVASRWTWLQAQISDLEYRIRQYNELHRQIRACKGTVALSEPTSPLRAAPMSPSAVNGYRGQLPGATKTNEDLANGAVATGSSGGSSGGSARTRPLHRPTFRKRKLLQTTGLHTVSKKASRPSNIRCGCVSPVVPCALCTGRTDPTFPRDAPDQLTVPERVALLDPGYHPVLSFPDDISQSIHLEAIMKLSDWQQKSLRCNLKSLKGIAKADRAEKAGTGVDNRPKKSEHRKKYNRLLKSELKNKIGRGRRFSRSSGSGMMRVHKKRHTAKMAMAQLNALASESMDEMEMEALMGPAGQAKGGNSLTPSPLSHTQVVPYRRNRVDSYDIDNIVIPYSVAAATRVEKLQYKEILTPKWRLIDCDFPAKYDVKNNGILRRASEDSDVEDVNEESIASRHDKCEHDEKKKFLSYIKFPLTAGRSRANRRTDSRAESSGANTPDPMSPHTGDPSEAFGSPLTSPPATPISMLTNNDDSSTSHTNPNSLRRRTVSQCRWASGREETRCATPENIETIAPYELRDFPLPEDVYEKMLKSMPEGHPLPSYMTKQSSRDSDVTEAPFSDSRADTPISDSTESAVAEEDPNDPEWVDVERMRERAKR